MVNPWRGFLFGFEGFGGVLSLFGRVRLCAGGVVGSGLVPDAA